MVFTVFAAQKKVDQVPGRLVVRRIPDAAWWAQSQAERRERWEAALRELDESS